MNVRLKKALGYALAIVIVGVYIALLDSLLTEDSWRESLWFGMSTSLSGGIAEYIVTKCMDKWQACRQKHRK